MSVELNEQSAVDDLDSQCEAGADHREERELD